MTTIVPTAQALATGNRLETLAIAAAHQAKAEELVAIATDPASTALNLQEAQVYALLAANMIAAAALKA